MAAIGSAKAHTVRLISPKHVRPRQAIEERYRDAEAIARGYAANYARFVDIKREAQFCEESPPGRCPAWTSPARDLRR